MKNNSHQKAAAHKWALAYNPWALIDLVKSTLGNDVQMQPSVAGGEKFIAVKPKTSPTLKAQQDFGAQAQALGYTAVWDGDNQQFKLLSERRLMSNFLRTRSRVAESIRARVRARIRKEATQLESEDPWALIKLAQSTLGPDLAMGPDSVGGPVKVKPKSTVSQSVAQKFIAGAQALGYKTTWDEGANQFTLVTERSYRESEELASNDSDVKKGDAATDAGAG